MKSTLLLLVLTTFSVNAQPKKQKVDGVVAVVGDFVLLASAIALLFIASNPTTSLNAISRCPFFGSLLHNNLFSHHPLHASIPVSEAALRGFMTEQLALMLDQ